MFFFTISCKNNYENNYVIELADDESFFYNHRTVGVNVIFS